MKKKKARKIVFIVLTGAMILGFSITGLGKNNDGYRAGNHYYTGASAHKGDSSHYQYYPRRNYPEDRRYYYKSQRQILKEIKKNDRRIKKLEHKLRKYYRKKYSYRYYKRYKYHYYEKLIRQIEWEISRLEHRNRYLKRLLYQER